MKKKRGYTYYEKKIFFSHFTQSLFSFSYFSGNRSGWRKRRSGTLVQYDDSDFVSFYSDFQSFDCNRFRTLFYLPNQSSPPMVSLLKSILFLCLDFRLVLRLSHGSKIECGPFTNRKNHKTGSKFSSSCCQSGKSYVFNRLSGQSYFRNNGSAYRWHRSFRFPPYLPAGSRQFWQVWCLFPAWLSGR